MRFRAHNRLFPHKNSNKIFILQRYIAYLRQNINKKLRKNLEQSDNFCIYLQSYKHFIKLDTMNKEELISAMAQESGLTKTDSRKALDAFISSVTTALKGGERVVLVGFGTFRTGVRAEKAGYDPANERPITIPSKRVAKFKAGVELSAAVE
jgi:DNA-binding protein HU-beta